jgi:ribosomal protein S18 acetylase RimI-like enzyme
MLIRPARLEDGPTVLAFMEQTGFFRPCEMEIADEVFYDGVDPVSAEDYRSFVAELDGRPVGWVCFGPTPCTVGAWDIYWIGVDKTVQHRRIGTRLIQFAEAEIQKAGGRLAVIETSGSDFYKPTQSFYLKNGYKLAAAVEDFYAPGDPKLIFTKGL